MTSPSAIYSLAYSPDGNMLAEGCADGRVRVWDPSKPASIVTISNDTGPIYSVAISADGKFLASGSNDRTVRLWAINGDVFTPTSMHHLEIGITSVAFSPDNQQLAAGSFDGKVYLWPVVDAADVATILDTHPNQARPHTVDFAVEAIAFSPDGKFFAAGDTDDNIYLWDLTQKGGVATVLRRPTETS